MRIPVVSSHSLGLPGVKATLELHPGQVYRGTIVNTTAEGVMLRIGGMLIYGAGRIPYKTGDPVSLRAERQSDTSLLLRVLPLESTPPNQSSLEQALRQLNLQPSEQNMAAVKALINWLQPVESEVVEQMMAEAKNFPREHRAAYLNLRGWTKAAELPEERVSIRAVTRFLLGLAEAEDIPQALKLINSSAAPSNYPDISVLWWQNPYHHGELYVVREGLKGYNPEHDHTLVLRVQTVHLGEVWVCIGYNPAFLDLTFFTHQQAVKSMLIEAQAEFAAALREHGVRLRGFTCHAQSPSSFLDIIPPLAETYSGINVVV